jgi:glucose/arabinose dehydrogenase
MKKIILLSLLSFSLNHFSQTLTLQSFATGFSSPVAIVNAGDDRLFVVQRGGAIRIVQPNGTVLPTNFLTLTSSTVLSGGERGLLGLAFHPNYVNNGFFYVNYTRAGDGATVIARYSVDTNNPNIANPNSAQILLTIPQPFSNHNGGSLVFGPDGFLYIGMGDGGSGGDPQNLAQNQNSLLGKMLRIDVDGGSPYGIPADNPNVSNAFPNEIWAIGMRNPWKFSFDRVTGDLWIADVGQNAREEINKVNAPLTPGLNFGWRCYEASLPFNTADCLSASNYTFPVAEYNLGGGNCSITGGYVYRGSTYPNMVGKYFFADYCSNRIGWVNNNGGTITWSAAFTGNFVSFGEDINGELYIAGITNGVISRVVDTSLSTQDFAAQGLVMAPNPANTAFTIQNELQKPIQEITVTDLSGKTLWKQQVSTESYYTVSTQNWSKGYYIVTVTQTDGHSFHSKLIVQ